jgi:hypothetical protein
MWQALTSIRATLQIELRRQQASNRSSQTGPASSQKTQLSLSRIDRLPTRLLPWDSSADLEGLSSSWRISNFVVHEEQTTSSRAQYSRSIDYPRLPTGVTFFLKPHIQQSIKYRNARTLLPGQSFAVSSQSLSNLHISLVARHKSSTRGCEVSLEPCYEFIRRPRCDTRDRRFSKLNNVYAIRE